MIRAAAALAVLLIGGCSQTSNGKDRVSPPQPSSDDASPSSDDSENKAMPSASFLDQIANKDFGSWSGLPADLPLTQLGDGIELGSARRDAVLGSERAKLQVLQARASGYAELFKIWLSGDRVVAIEIELPQLSDPGGLLAELGQAALELDTLIPTTGAKLAKGLRVYPARGLAARMSTDGKNITALWLFAATTAETYQKSLAPADEFRESP